MTNIYQTSAAIWHKSIPLPGLAHPATVAALQRLLLARQGLDSIPIGPARPDDLLDAGKWRYKAVRAQPDARNALDRQALCAETRVAAGLWSVQAKLDTMPDAVAEQLAGTESTWLDWYLALAEHTCQCMAAKMDRDAVFQRLATLLRYDWLPETDLLPLKHLYCAGSLSKADASQIFGLNRAAGAQQLLELITRDYVQLGARGYVLTESLLHRLFPALS